MTLADSPERATTPASPGPGLLSRLAASVDSAGVAVSDRLNPLLVKEVRQALKSRQFLITFCVLLGAAWTWSLLGLMMAMPPADMLRPIGWEMFLGYYFILAFALLVVVPYACYHSMNTERDDNTLELVTISTLRPRQIVAGKLLAAAVQIVMHTSALAPCLAFTYLLRGVDLVAIIWLVGLTIAISLGLALCGLVLATVTTERHWHVVLSVFVSGELIVIFIAVCSVVGDGPGEIQGPAFRSTEFLAVFPLLAAIGVAYFALLARVAAARLTFPADNRSTGVRWAMLLPHAAWLAFLGLVAFHPMFDNGRLEGYVFVFTVIAVQWTVFGFVLQCESPEMSRRVRRQLPQSVLARVFLSWFAPGPGTGHVFAVCGVLAAGLVTVLMARIHVVSAPAGSSATLQAQFPWVVTCTLAISAYITLYLGLGLLVVRWFRRLRWVSSVGMLLLQPLPLLAGTCIPMVLQQLLNGSLEHYSPLQLTNPFWTCIELDRWNLALLDKYLFVRFVWAMALAVLALNASSILKELRQVRIAAPPRVVDDDAQASQRVPRGPKNPWERSDDA